MPAKDCSKLAEGLSRRVKVIPTSYLYDKRGSELYDDITNLVEYYPYLEEQRLLRLHATEIAEQIPPNGIVVELGCGNALKTSIILQAVAARHGRCHFAGIDVSAAFLAEAHSNVHRIVTGGDMVHCTTSKTAAAEKTAPSDGQKQRRHCDLPHVITTSHSGIGKCSGAFLSGCDGRLTGDPMGASGTGIRSSTNLNGHRHCHHDPQNGSTAGPSATTSSSSGDDDANGGRIRVAPQLGPVQPMVATQATMPSAVTPAVAPAVSMTVETVEAEYLEGLHAVRRVHPHAMLTVLWLGASVGNFSDDEIVDFFKSMQRIAGSNMQLLLCADLWKDRQTLFEAYCDPQGVTEAFIKNGAVHALRSLGYHTRQGEQEAWRYEVVVSEEKRRVEMWLLFPHGVRLPAPLHAAIKPGDRVLMEISRKFLPSDVAALAAHSSMHLLSAWRSPLYSMQLLLPCEAALLRVWRDSDDLFDSIRDWNHHPIAFRHPFCFYYGHVSAFGVLKLLPHRPPSTLDLLFSRGMDPLLLNPSHCHAHPPIPPCWPSRPEITAYVREARQLMLQAVRGSVQPPSSRLIALVLEHERMHHETLAYMQLQADVAALRAQQQQQQQLNGSVALPSPPSPLLSPCLPPLLDVLIPSGSVTMGTDVSGVCDGFVWDNEGPPVTASVPRPFAVSSHPVTVAQFHAFVTELRGYHRPELWQEEDDFTFLHRHGIQAPSSWVLCRAGILEEEGEGDSIGSEREKGGQMEYWVCGWGREAKPWHEVGDEAVMVSLAEAQAFCRAMEMEGEGQGGYRVMREEEWHRIVQWQPTVVTPAAAAAAAAAKARERVVDVDSCEHGHSSNRSVNGSRISAGEGEGAEHCALQRLQRSVREGGWEWTSSKFQGFEGFQAMAEYPEYSTDFFDGLHFVLKGSSAATHPSLKRDSFRNYYQRQYPFMFAKFRCCRDVDGVNSVRESEEEM